MHHFCACGTGKPEAVHTVHGSVPYAMRLKNRAPRAEDKQFGASGHRNIEMLCIDFVHIENHSNFCFENFK